MKRAQLQLMPLEEAQRLFFARVLLPDREEERETSAALGRVTSRACYAQRDLPHYPMAAMDGIAVRACAARPGEKLRRGRDFEYVDTGDPIPEPFDSVVKIEEVRELGEDTVEIERAPSPGMHVRAVGEDFARGALVVPAGACLTPEAIAALLATGNLTVWVKSQPKIVFIPTGSELVSPEREPAVGEIVETNSQLVKGLVSRWGGAVTVTESVPNELAILRSAVREALARFDIVLVGAGTSKGRSDWVAQVVRELGEVVVHGVAYHPGHPVLLGVCEQKPVVGLPGYPVATWLALQLFVRPVLERYYYGQERPRLSVWARLAQPIKSGRGFREFVRARLERLPDGSWLVHPKQGGASKLSTLVHIDGWIEVPEDVASLPAGTLVEVKLTTP
jgi:molybdenum cofactor synthesis domain-containing protein